MDDIFFSNNYIEMIAGTDNTIARSYREAVKLFDEKASHQVISPAEKEFLTNISNEISKFLPKIDRDNAPIKSSAGNIEAYSEYKSLLEAIGYIEKLNLKRTSIAFVRKLLDAIKSLRTQYMRGYKNKSKMIMLEYESAVYLLTEAVSWVIVNEIEVQLDESTGRISLIPKRKTFSQHDVLMKTVRDLGKELSDKSHVAYLNALNSLEEESALKKPAINDDKKDKEKDGTKDIKESVEYFEEASEIVSFISKLVDIGAQVVKSAPLAIKKGLLAMKKLVSISTMIRNVVYLHYYRKAKKIKSYEQRIAFIQLNIERLKNRTDMDSSKKEEIIRKQKAYIAKYTARAEKLRAELEETQKEVAKHADEANKNIKTQSTTLSSSDDGKQKSDNNKTVSEDDMSLE